MSSAYKLLGDPLKVQLLTTNSFDNQLNSDDFVSLVGFKNIPQQPESFEELVANLKYEKIPATTSIDINHDNNAWDCQVDEFESFLVQDNE